MGENVSRLDTVSEVVKIPRDRIDANAANFYEMSDLETLADSIALTGLLHPLLVKPGAEEGRYTLIDGERRFRAMCVLEWAECPAIIQRPASTVLEKLMLIEANRTQRKMNSAELSKQAEEYTELLAELKRSGVEIPGRLRDAVAKALDVSASKLARLAAIRKKIIPAWLECFDQGTLNESVAYELSQLDSRAQTDMLYFSVDQLTAELVSGRGGKLQAIYSRSCAVDGKDPHGPCPNIDACVKRTLEVPHSWMCCSSCCLSCYDRWRCEYACLAAKKANEEADRQRAERQEQWDRERQEREQQEAGVRAALSGYRANAEEPAQFFWERFEGLCRDAGVGKNELHQICGYIDTDDLQAIIDGEAEDVSALEFLNEIGAGDLLLLSRRTGHTIGSLFGESGGWDWKDGRKELPQSEDSREMVITWGPTIGVRCVPVKDYQDYRDNFKGNYDWWCRPQLPTPEGESEE